MNHKVLYLILDHHSAEGLSKSCQQTWIKNIPENDEVLFIGDPLMPDKIGRHEVYKPLQDEPKQCQSRITEKIMHSFKYALKKNWDFVLRIDVDAYCNIDNLHEFIKNLDSSQDHYFGQGIHFKGDSHPCYLSNVGDKLPPKEYKYYYAQGGCYLISRAALKKAIPYMYYPAPIEARAEDIMIGDALAKSGVKLSDRPDLFCSGYEGKGWPRMPMRNFTTEEHIKKITKEGYISTHKISPDLIKKIHNKLKPQNHEAQVELQEQTNQKETNKSIKIYGQLPDWILKINQPQSFRDTGHNYGNMIFWYAVAKFLQDASITSTLFPSKLYQSPPNEHYYEKYFDIRANQITRSGYESFVELKNLTKQHNSKLKFLLSIGCQNINSEIFSLPDKARLELQQTFESFDKVNLRGFYTESLLRHNKINYNFDVLGCPSSYLLRDTHIQFNECKTSDKILLMHPGGYDMPQLLTLFDKLETIDGCSSLFQTKLGNKEDKSPPNCIEKFFKQVKAADFVFGTRIHGSVAALSQGTPCICIAIDCRTKELCEIMHIPFVDWWDLKIRESLENIKNKEDLSRFINKHFDIDFQQIKKQSIKMQEYLTSLFID